MKQTRIMMDMPITVEIVDDGVTNLAIDKVFEYFEYIEQTFSTFKPESEISQINRGEILPDQYSADMKTVLALSAETKQLTNGYFDIKKVDGSLDPSGLVKGWAIQQAALQLVKNNFRNFYIDAGGDIQVAGQNSTKQSWSVGIRNPFKRQEIVKVVYLKSEGIATSGTYIRGQHVINPHHPSQPISEIVSVTVIGPNVFEADRFATAALAMGKAGIMFIEKMSGFEGYQIDRQGQALFTSGFAKYLRP